MKRILTFFLLALAMSFLPIYGQAKTKVTLMTKDTSLKEILHEISDQTEYKFFYPDHLLDDIKTSLNVKNEDIDKVMSLLLKNHPIKYRISNKTVYLTKDDTPQKEIVPDKKVVTGIVKDTQGEVLTGVTVKKAGTQIATITDIDGHYSVEAIEGDQLQFTYLGFKQNNIKVGKSPVLNIALEEDSYQLDEMVVVGYGVQRKSDLTSSISKISFDKLADMPVSNIEMALQGQAAGVNISSTSGRPGAGVQIRIRGVGTINNNEPLYVVDGMPVSDISYLNMSDIESIEILKDASSAAIYGTRAANGVVMVSSKKGKISGAGSIPELEVSFDSYWGIANPTKDLKPANSDEYLFMVEQIYGQSSTTYNLVKKEYDKGYNTNWWKEVNREDALQQNYNISVTGGNSRATYLMSGGYMSQDGIDRKSSSERISSRINTSYKAKDFFRIGENLSITNTKIKGGGDSGEDGFVSSALRTDPLYPVMNLDKNESNEFNNYGTSSLTNIKNPVAVQDRYLKTRNGNEYLRIVGNVFGEVTFLNDFLFRTDIGLEFSRNEFSSFSPVYYLKVDDQNKVANAWSQFEKGFRWTWINTLNYSKKIQDHNISSVIGYQSEEYIYQNLEGNKFGQPNNNPEFQWVSGGISGDRISGGRSEDALLSYFGRVNYAFADRYLLSASVRRDGSSKFAKDNRWGTFPAVSAGWRVTEEPFLKNLELNWLSSFKLRAGWGQLGNQRISSGAYNTFIEGSIKTRFYFNGEEHVQGYGPINAGNPDVSWERTETTNLGFDMSMLSSKLNITFDWFNKDTKGMLIQVPIPDMFGTFSPWENIGKVNNKGWEFSADYRNKIDQVAFSASFNLSSYTNKVISMGGTKPYVDSADGSGRIGGYSRTMEGEPIGFFYGYKTDGIFQTPEDVMNYLDANGNMIQPNAKMGDFKFVDVDNNGVLDDNDKVKLGKPHPDIIFGFNLSAAYRGFDVSAIFNGVYGNELFNAFKYYTHQPLGFANVASGAAYDAWTIGSGINNQPRMTIEDTNDNFRISDFYVEDGSYLRLKNLQIGYTLPQQVTQKLRLSTLRFYISAQNLFTITNYSGLDPEVATNYDRANGVDIGAYPQTRIFQFGLNLKF